jgi:hypothetical protein|uniref:Uncharacterized protein n=1 Tax=Eutreptiella gymnastica TaxID=73025 RepID=A0A6T2I0M4_9EUGL
MRILSSRTSQTATPLQRCLNDTGYQQGLTCSCVCHGGHDHFPTERGGGFTERAHIFDDWRFCCRIRLYFPCGSPPKTITFQQQTHLHRNKMEVDCRDLMVRAKVAANIILSLVLNGVS